MTIKGEQIVIAGWPRHYNRIVTAFLLGYKPPAQEVVAWPASPVVESARPP